METPRSRKRQRQHEPTTLMSLGDDMLAEILRRLPSRPSLARAAFACPQLRSDFQLAGFGDYRWRLMDCRVGLLLLTSDRCVTVFDPLSGSRLRIPHCSKSSFHCFLPACGDVTSFRVLCLEGTGGGRVRPHVYSSSTGEWCSHSLAPNGIRPPRRGDQHSFHHYLPMHAGRRIYWKTSTEEILTFLDVASMNFSHVPFPDKLYRYSSYSIGDMEDGTTCIVAVSNTATYHKLDMEVWFLKEEDGSWERQWRGDASHLVADRISVAKICDVTAGIVLLSTGFKNKGLRYTAFSLKDTLRERTTKLADFFTSAGWVHPYFMAWPRPSLPKAAGSTEDSSTSESEQEDASTSESEQEDASTSEGEQEDAAGSNKKKQV